MDIEVAAATVQKFEGGSLKDRLRSLEGDFHGLNRKGAAKVCDANSLNPELLKAAFSLKQIAGQINVIIHASGILAALPSILEDSEVIESLSLGAGNIGRDFDLETNRRVAEFKFINWKGGSESIRQNSLFKDFYELAEAETDKAKYLYVLGLEWPMKFFAGRRKLSSVMSRNVGLAQNFNRRFGDRFEKVHEYYESRKERVRIEDLTPIVPELAGIVDVRG